MRDRLIALIKQAERDFSKTGRPVIDIEEYVADSLLATGVIVPPCKVGDDIYWIDAETKEIVLAKADVKAVCYYGEDKFKLVCGDDTEPEKIGTQWCMLTKEEAEKALAERREG